MGEGLAFADAASRNGGWRSILDAIGPLAVISAVAGKPALPHARKLAAP